MPLLRNGGSMKSQKALQTTADEVSLSQLGIRQGAIAEANSEAIDLSTFNTKADIKSAFSLVEEAKAALKDPGLGRPTRKIRKHFYKALKTLKLALEHSQGYLSSQCRRQLYQNRHGGCRGQGSTYWALYP